MIKKSLNSKINVEGLFRKTHFQSISNPSLFPLCLFKLNCHKKYIPSYLSHSPCSGVICHVTFLLTNHDWEIHWMKNCDTWNDASSKSKRGYKFPPWRKRLKFVISMLFCIRTDLNKKIWLLVFCFPFYKNNSWLWVVCAASHWRILGWTSTAAKRN